MSSTREIDDLVVQIKKILDDRTTEQRGMMRDNLSIHEDDLEMVTALLLDIRTQVAIIDEELLKQRLFSAGGKL